MSYAYKVSSSMGDVAVIASDMRAALTKAGQAVSGVITGIVTVTYIGPAYLASDQPGEPPTQERTT